MVRVCGLVARAAMLHYLSTCLVLKFLSLSSISGTSTLLSLDLLHHVESKVKVKCHFQSAQFVFW